MLNYVITFYVIFHHTSQNLMILREHLSFIEDEDIHAMHEAVYAKYTMFKYVLYQIYQTPHLIFWYLYLVLTISYCSV